VTTWLQSLQGDDGLEFDESKLVKLAGKHLVELTEDQFQKMAGGFVGIPIYNALQSLLTPGISISLTCLTSSITLQSTAQLKSAPFHSSHCTTLHYYTVLPHCTTLHCTTLHCTALHYTTRHYRPQSLTLYLNDHPFVLLFVLVSQDCTHRTTVCAPLSTQTRNSNSNSTKTKTTLTPTHTPDLHSTHHHSRLAHFPHSQSCRPWPSILQHLTAICIKHVNTISSMKTKIPISFHSLP
jgi:hypothetical protein